MFLLKNLHGNIGNLLWRIACGEWYRRLWHLDRMVFLIKSDRDYRRFCQFAPYMGWTRYEVLRRPPEDTDFIQFRNMPVNTKYYPLPASIEPGRNVWMSGSNESPLFWNNDFDFVHDLFISHDNPYILDAIAADTRVLDRFGLAGCPFVSVNVRRGADKLALQDKYVIPTVEWLTRAMNRFPGMPFVFTSDDPDWCRRHFSHRPDCFFSDIPATVPATVPDASPSGSSPKWMRDLLMATLASHNIISNSTFSWWGAYLNPHPGKQVIYSLPWYRHRTPSQTDSIPPTWIPLQ